MSKKKILMQRFNGTGYDPQYPETHVKNVTGINQTVANNVGVAATDGATVIGEMSEIDYFVSPQGTTTGTSTAYNLNIGSQYTSLDDMDGVVIRVKFHTTTGDNPTLNVNGLGAKPILAENGVNIPYQIGENVWATLIWSSTLNGWIVQGWGKKRVFKTEVIKESTGWTVPDVDGPVNVRIFGGGAGGQAEKTTFFNFFFYDGGCGGGGGHMATKDIMLTRGKNVLITIGKGGAKGAGNGNGERGSAGGTSSFGTYISANGGQCPNGGSGGGGGQVYSSGGTASYGGAGGSKGNKGSNGIAAAGGKGLGGDYGRDAGGGGGGYGGNGGGGSSGGGGGGGGYGLNGNGSSAGTNNKAGWAAGGCGAINDDNAVGTDGGSGICILTYWAWE